jgi:hypothetical protein
LTVIRIADGFTPPSFSHYNHEHCSFPYLVCELFPSGCQFCPETRRKIRCRWMCGLLGTLHCDYLVVRRMYSSCEGPEEWRSSGAGSIPYPMYARGEHTVPPSGIHHVFSGPPSINSHQVHNHPTIGDMLWWRKSWSWAHRDIASSFWLAFSRAYGRLRFTARRI